MMPCMTRDSVDSAARELVAARMGRRMIERLSESCRPSTDEEALTIQRRVIEMLGDKIGGWKCSLPRAEHLFLAPLPASTIRQGSPCSILPEEGQARIEPEVAFVIGSDLAPRRTAYKEDDV